MHKCKTSGDPLMSVYSELIAITNRAIKEKWYAHTEGAKNDKKERCLAIIGIVNDLEKAFIVPNQPALADGAEASSARSNITDLTEKTLQDCIAKLQSYDGRTDITLMPDAINALLRRIRQFQFQGTFSTESLAIMYPEDMPADAVTAVASPLVFKGSIFGRFEKSMSFEATMRRIAKELYSMTQDTIERVPPRMAPMFSEQMAGFLKLTFNFQLPGTRQERMRLLGFGISDRELDSTLHALVQQARSKSDAATNNELYQQMSDELKTAVDTFFSGSVTAFLMPLCFSDGNINQLSKEQAGELLRSFKKSVVDHNKAGDTDKIVSLLTAMIMAGYPQAWDTALRDEALITKDQWLRYSLLAVMALDSAQSDELTSMSACESLLKNNSLTNDALLNVLQSMLTQSAVSVELQTLKCGLATLFSLASQAAKNPGETIKSTSHQRNALLKSMEVCLIASVIQFQKDPKSDFFNALLQAAISYKILHVLHEQLCFSDNADTETFGSGDAFLTEEMRRALMRSENPEFNGDASTSQCKAMIYRALAYELLYINDRFGSGLGSQSHQSLKDFGEYLFTQSETLLNSANSPVRAVGYFAESGPTPKEKWLTALQNAVDRQENSSATLSALM